MKIVSESVLKDKMSEHFREIENTGEELLVTNNGELVLRIISYHRDSENNEAYPENDTTINHEDVLFND